MIRKLINYLFVLRLVLRLKMKEGNKAPDFVLKDKDSNEVRLSEIDSNYTVVYFYPKDDTPGCTIEANEFSSVLDEFEKLGVRVIGISGGDEVSKKKFCEKHELRVTLLSDIDYRVCKKYDAYGEKKFMGRTYDGIFRVTYVLDKDKKVIKTYGKVKAAGHAAEVLEFTKRL
jgi:thioredoxin-dependent peroxiredoxin